MLKQYRLRDYRFRLVFYVVALTIIGIMVVGSAKPSVQNKQIAGLILGLIVMVGVSLIDYNFILKFSWIFYFINVALLAAIFVHWRRDKRSNALAEDWNPFPAFRIRQNPVSSVFCLLSKQK